MLPTVTEEYPYDLIGPTDDASDTCESCDTAETGDTEVWQPERATKDPSGCFRFTSSTEDVFGPYSVIEAVPEDTSSTADPEWNPGEEDKSSSANESQTQDACNQEPYYVSSDDVDKLEDEQANSEELHNEDATEQSFQHKDKEKDIESADEYADIDDSICLKDDNAQHSDCVSSEDYVEIGEEDEEEEVEKKHIRVKSANKRTAQREQALRGQRKSCQPRLRLCNITVPADLDFGCTPELTNRVVFAHTTEAFEEDIEELDGHIVPYYEDTDSDSDEHIYVEVGFESEGENVMSLDRKTIVTRSRSYSGKVSNYVPETVPEETGTETHDYCTVPEDKSSGPHSPLEQPAVNCITPSTKSRRFLLSSRSADGPGLSFLTSAENDQSLQNEIRIRRKDDTLSLPCVITSSGSFSQRSHQSSSGVSTPTSLADIPPPFELVPITKRPVTKSSPSLLIQHELSETPKKKKSSFKRFLAFKFKRKTDPKGFSDGSVRSSRSSSESSHHGVRLIELDCRSNGSSPQLQSAMVSPQQHPSNLPSSLILCKDPHRRKGDLKADGKGVSRVESFEERSRRPIMPLPMTKPRSISFPSADTSDYENIPAMSSDYENIQIPGRPTRSHTVTEFFENPNRTTVMSNENDGYVDMNSFPGIDSKPQTLKVPSSVYHTALPPPPPPRTPTDTDTHSLRDGGYSGDLKLSPPFPPPALSFRNKLSVCRRVIFICVSSFGLPQENLLRLVHIEYSVKGKRDLLKPGRIFVKEGTLMKVSRKSRQPRHLFLMNDIMLYTYPQQDGKYRLKNTLSLSGMKVSKPVVDNVLNCLRIEVSDVTITLSASSVGEREDWFHTLSRAIADHAAGLCTFGGPCSEAREKLWMALGEAAPVLLPVSQVMMCMNCTTDFSLTLRRHHCNACGKVVCRACSRNRYPLKYLKDRMAKVCDHCYTELRKRACGNSSPRTHRASRPLSAVFQSLQPPSLWKSRKSSSNLSQDKVASESLPLRGFTVKLTEKPDGEESSNVFQLYHKKTLYYTFRADDQHTARRWVNAIEEATVL
uniref:FYVE, RhoGEF and PH domain containing 5a n=1 Tax=Xiphophorus couchianus TaxID=32473 RepID=A0A3B5MU67_9TELE